MAVDIHWICGNYSLGWHCHEWQQLPFVAIDTEFMRINTFYPLAGLIQIGDGISAYLIDPLTINNWQPLAALLENPAVTKVLHACSEDLEVLRRLTGSLPIPLFDTQLAAAYLNLGFSMGYSRLVRAVLNIELSKGETRSNWLQRPLSEMQISYAIEDAAYLAEVYMRLRSRLSDNKYAWVLEDGAELVSSLRREVNPYEVYCDAKLAWKLSRSQLVVLRELCAWREQQARARDLPRNRIIYERSLWLMATYRPDNLVALGKIACIHQCTLHQDGQALLDLIKHAGSVSMDQWPLAVSKPLPVDAAVLIKQLRALGQAEAQRLKIAPELMLRKKILEVLVKSGYPSGPYKLPDMLRGWRRELMGQALLDGLATVGK
ncbi:ribonuclease D [Candidatus Pseudomonas adelgestsugas]|uniref:Ribonuclease D n=1 Tax=Candidatus Pseudomonas adelgestsugas TaxID=1302376 RepID=A0ABX5R904_9PSED|nr:ribonuclease D [Candidatus Pseudomonas adelgestsugas]QAX82043.1 Ribonuclease D [Candidatus Pseudomonas adelgestsugas]